MNDNSQEGMLNNINNLETELNDELKPIVISDEGFDTLAEMVENPPEPNEALHKALKGAVEKGFL
jgi:uncharacterized protein (DUF1778 family)